MKGKLNYFGQKQLLKLYTFYGILYAKFLLIIIRLQFLEVSYNICVIGIFSQHISKIQNHDYLKKKLFRNHKIANNSLSIEKCMLLRRTESEKGQLRSDIKF